MIKNRIKTGKNQFWS